VQSSLTIWLLIGILAVLIYALAVPRICTTCDNSRLAAAAADIHGGIKTALDHYKTDNGFFPKNLNDLLQRTDDAKHWSGPYLEQLPIDPWGDNYIYEFPGKHNPSSYDLLSAGPDGKEGTDDDIGNWQFN
jgi:general secretion pathway protein G